MKIELHVNRKLEEIEDNARGSMNVGVTARGAPPERFDERIATSGWLTRREFLITTAAAVGGGMSISLLLRPRAFAAEQLSNAVEVGAWLAIAADDTVVLRVPLPESGNGAMTHAAAIVAEELQCDWSRTRAESISLNRDAREANVYGAIQEKMSTFAGRSTTPDITRMLQQIGASARERLKTAAARHWNVPVTEIEARNSVLKHVPTNRTLRYGEMAATAATIVLEREPSVKAQKDWTFLGKASYGKLADPAIVNGTAVYGIDVNLPGMLHGALMQSPVHGGMLKRHDFEAIRSMPGVLGVVVIDPREPRKRLKTPPSTESYAQSAIVVVAEHYWQARKALEALPLEWDDGPGARWKTTEQVNASVLADLDRAGDKIVKNEGGRIAGPQPRPTGARIHVSHAVLRPGAARTTQRYGACH